MSKIFPFLVAIVFSIHSFSQVGINTQDPKSMLDVWSTGNAPFSNILLIENSDNKPIIVVKSDGRVGLGVDSPITRLDLRDNKDNSIIGVRESQQSASEALAGALRYDPSQKLISFSDGTKWINLSANPIKSRIIATLPSFTFPDLTTVTLNGWKKTLDVNNSFDPSTGVFTASVDGVYNITLEVILQQGPLPASSYFLVTFVTSGGQAISSISAKEAAGNYYVESFSATSIEMLAGETLTVTAWHNFGTEKLILSEFNILTIIEN